jgi:hypothetical protein
VTAVPADDARYTIISADAHAGLPCEEYRPYLDTRYHDAFDQFLAERQANRDEQMVLNYDYITNWETTHEEGLRGAWDASQRDKEMDADGVAAMAPPPIPSAPRRLPSRSNLRNPRMSAASSSARSRP